MSEIDKKLNIVEKETQSQQTDKISKKDDLDVYFRMQKKQHRNTLSKIDHVFKVLTHPFSLFIIVCIIFLLFFVIRCVRIFVTSSSYGCALRDVELDILHGLSYFGTGVISHIITKYIDAHHK